MTIYEAINGLLQYGEIKNIYESDDKEYILNALLAVFKLDEFDDNLLRKFFKFVVILSSILFFKNSYTKVNDCIERFAIVLSIAPFSNSLELCSFLPG